MRMKKNLSTENKQTTARRPRFASKRGGIQNMRRSRILTANAVTQRLYDAAVTLVAGCVFPRR
jgi:hypothetical protein